MELVDRAVLTATQPGSEGNAASAQEWAESADGRSGWRVDCHDVANRRRVVTVLVDHGSVVLVRPPGETAVLSAPQVSQLQAVLREAANQAER